MEHIRRTEPRTNPHDPASIAARVAMWRGDGLFGATRRLPPPGPVTLELYPTLSCNLDCSFCDTTDRKRPPVHELSDARLLTLIDEAAELGVERVFILGGGEPLARRSLIGPLLAAVKRHGLEGVLTTNGTLLSGELAQQLVDTGWDEVHLSIDGDNAATHDRLRGRPGAFRQTVRNACRLGVFARRSGRSLPRIGLHFVITRENFRQLSGMVRLGHALGAHRIDFDALIAYTPDQLRLRLLPEEREALPELAAEAGRLADELGITTTLDLYRTPERAERGKELPIAPKGEGTGLERAPCLKAWHHIVVGPDGRVAPCCVLSGTGGSVAEQPLSSVWRTDSFLEEVRLGMSQGQPRPRCVECSPNILAHEGLIAASLRELAVEGAQQP